MLNTRLSRWLRRPRWNMCCGFTWASRWCALDAVTRCKIKSICDHHDAHLLREFAAGDPSTSANSGATSTYSYSSNFGSQR